jgi:hypothetical protein
LASASVPPQFDLDCRHAILGDHFCQRHMPVSPGEKRRHIRIERSARVRRHTHSDLGTLDSTPIRPRAKGNPDPRPEGMGSRLHARRGGGGMLART